MSHPNRNPSGHHRLDTTATFFDQLKFTLDNYRAPALLGAESPLAQPYFLGQTLHGLAEATTNIGRGTVLCRELERAVAALWQGTPPDEGAALLQAALQAKEDRACATVTITYSSISPIFTGTLQRRAINRRSMAKFYMSREQPMIAICARRFNAWAKCSSYGCSRRFA